MKKFIFMAALAAGTFGMSAQLTVLKSGNVRIGNDSQMLQIIKSASSVLPPSEEATTKIQTDSLATLNILGPKVNGFGGYITFGDGKNVGIGELDGLISNTDGNMLSLFGSGGITYKAGSTKVFSFDSRLTSTPFVFYRDVRANAFLTTSDARMKRDINDLNGVGSILADITPVSYHLTNAPEVMKAMSEDVADDNIEQEDYGTPSDRLQYGFVAQEVKEIFPNLVVEDENGYLSIDYLGFIPILVDAYKNLEARVKEQDETIAALSNPSTPKKSPSAYVDNIISGDKATLLQNRPNPFRESTSISCTVPEGSSEAFICIYDLQGKQVSRHDIETRGNATVTVDGSSLQPGMYIYALIIDGAEIDSKKMILTD